MRRPGLRRLAGASLLAAAVPVGVASAWRGGASGEGAGAPVTVRLTAHHSRFTPSIVEVPPGTAVRFVVRNLDPIDHELIVGGPDVHRRHQRGRDAHHHGDVPGEVSVPAGETRATTITIPATDTFTLACHLPGHLAYGMSGVVVTTRT